MAYPLCSHFDVDEFLILSPMLNFHPSPYQRPGNPAWQYPLHDLMMSPRFKGARCIPVSRVGTWRNVGLVDDLKPGESLLARQVWREHRGRNINAGKVSDKKGSEVRRTDKHPRLLCRAQQVVCWPAFLVPMTANPCHQWSMAVPTLTVSGTRMTGEPSLIHKGQVIPRGMIPMWMNPWCLLVS